MAQQRLVKYHKVGDTMANNADGSIVLSVTIDKSSMNKSLNELKNGSKGLGNFKKSVNEVSTALKQMATTLGVAFGVREVLRFSNEASKLASQTEASVKRLGTLYGEYGQEVYDWANENANALGMSKTAAYQAAAAYGNIFTTFADGKESADLTKDVLQATAVIASQTGRTYEETFEKIQSGLYGNTRAIDDLGISVRQSSLMQTEAYKKISQNGTKSWNELTDAELQQVRALAIVEQSTAKYGNNVLQSTALARSQFNSAWEDFKSTWGTIINGVLIPVLNALTKILNYLTVGLSYIAKLMGKTQELSSTQSGIEYNKSDDIDENTEAQKEYNKELKKTVAGFDELEILNSNKSGETTIGSESEVATIAPSKANSSLESPDVSSWKSAIAGLVSILVGAGLVALGIILCTHGQVPIGIGCIIAGLFAMGIGVVMLNNSFNTSDAKDILLLITTIGGTLLIVLGIILLVCGQIPWGIGAILGGLALLGYTAYKVFKGLTEKELKSFISKLTLIVGGALLVIGVILIALGYLPIGIGCILIGIVALVASAYINWDKMSDKTKKWLSVLFAIISVATLVIGIIMLCTGHITPLSIGLILVGAVGLVSVAAINWDKIKNSVKSVLNAILILASGALLVIGIILLCTGHIPLGIALILAGIASAVTVVAINWNAILDKIKAVWNSIKSYWNNNIAKYFSGSWWANLGKNMINGLIGIIEAGLNGIVDRLNGYSITLPQILGGGTIGFNLNRVYLPRLAQGAVIPANHEFLAVLGDQKHGTNIETPVSTMKEAFRDVLNERGNFSQSNDKIVIQAILDGDVLFEKIVEKNRAYKNAMGVNALGV